jgi:hypothetical protein
MVAFPIALDKKLEQNLNQTLKVLGHNSQLID